MLDLDSIAKSNNIRPANSRKEFSAILSESYNLLFDCPADKSNLHSLIESHICDVQSNPRKLTELNRNLSILKALQENENLDDDRLVVSDDTVFDIDTTGHVVADLKTEDNPSTNKDSLTAEEIAKMSGIENEGDEKSVKESKSTRDVLKKIAEMGEGRMSRKSMIEGDCDSSKEICLDKDDEECTKLREADVRDFEKNDWYSYAGATEFADGSAPVIAEMNDFEDGSTVIVVGDAECFEVDVFGADDSSMTYVKSHDFDPETSADILDDMRDLVNSIEIAPTIGDVTKVLNQQGFAAEMLENRCHPTEACGYKKKKKNESTDDAEIEDQKLREAEVRDFVDTDFEDFDAEAFADGSAPVIAETEIADKDGNTFFVTLVADAYGFELDLINENGESYSYMKAHETAPESSTDVLDKMKTIVDGLETADDVHAVSVMTGMEGFKALFESKVSVEAVKKFAENCKGKSFVKGLKESKTITESKGRNSGNSDMALYKAGCSMMTQMAIELEKNSSFRESFTVMSDVLDKHLDKMRESINKGVPFSKKVVEGLNMFYKAILTESDDDEIADFKSWVEDEYDDMPAEENFQDPEAENPEMPDELIGDEQVNPDEREAEEIHEIAADKAEELIDECPATAAEIATEIVKQLLENPENSVEECLAKFGYSKTLKEAEGDEDSEDEDEETDEGDLDASEEDDIETPVDDDTAAETVDTEDSAEGDIDADAEDSTDAEVKAPADEVVYDFNGVEISPDEFKELKAFLNIRRGNPIDAEITEEPTEEESAVLESKLLRLRAKK